ncbi:hypothetical protein [Priestia filamentosa]|uniref:hypothetical protein n=1 Tax=Priestia filamentosa TaxID=1402861 RepID=UPI002E1ACED3|nr:hypothetical protein [Priestia filamentosa]
MKPEIIVMLTHNDVTSKDASTIFDSCIDLPVKYWGFKDVGISHSEMAALSKKMKDAGKTTVLEVVTFTEESCMQAARLAYECGIDYLTGTVFFPSVMDFIKDKNMKFYPFGGNVKADPIITLEGEVEEIVADCEKLKQRGVDGVDLVAYRSQNVDPIELAKKVIQTVGNENVIIAGSINSLERMQLMNEVGPLAYTMGGALFEGKFVEGGSFRDNLEFVVQALESM